MYTKEDVGATVYLPQYRQQPLKIAEFDSTDIPVLVQTLNGGFAGYFTNEGKGDGDDPYPVLSRTPYIVGQPFRCVTEKPARTLAEIKASDTPPSESEWKLLRGEWEEDESAKVQPDDAPFKVGDKITHVRHGEGRVLNIDYGRGKAIYLVKCTYMTVSMTFWATSEELTRLNP